MPKVSVVLDGQVIKEVELTKERTTLGRRPYNDIVVDNLTVSGEHVALNMVGDRVTAEDLNSTNGTYIGGRAIKTHLLHHDDVLEVGKFKIKFESEPDGDAFEKTMIFKPGAAGMPKPSGMAARPPAPPPPPPPPVVHPELHGWIKVLSGSAVGREMALTKIVTTVGKPGVSVAAITQRRHGFVVHHVEGNDRLLLNGIPVTEEPSELKNGDLIVLAGTQMQFFLR
jgi:hypothetical protein